MAFDALPRDERAIINCVEIAAGRVVSPANFASQINHLFAYKFDTEGTPERYAYNLEKNIMFYMYLHDFLQTVFKDYCRKKSFPDEKSFILPYNEQHAWASNNSEKIRRDYRHRLVPSSKFRSIDSYISHLQEEYVWHRVQNSFVGDTVEIMCIVQNELRDHLFSGRVDENRL